MYIEFVIVDNFVLTLLAGSAAARLCHKRVNIWRLIAAAAVGTVVAVFYPFLRSSAAEFAVKLALWCVLSFQNAEIRGVRRAVSRLYVRLRRRELCARSDTVFERVGRCRVLREVSALPYARYGRGGVHRHARRGEKA